MSVSGQMYTIAEFCRVVGISKRHYFRLRSDGRGPRVTILGGKHLISSGETQRWLTINTERNWINV